MSDEDDAADDGDTQEHEMRGDIMRNDINRLRDGGENSSEQKGLREGICEGDTLKFDTRGANGGEIVMGWPCTGIRK